MEEEEEEINLQAEIEECFDTNSEYWKKIEAIIDNCRQFPRVIASGRELHHIIPKTYFKTMELPTDNSAYNLISLKPSEHYLIHYYYWKCSKEIIHSAMALAFSFMYQNSSKEMSEKELQISAAEYEQARKEQYDKLSEGKKGKEVSRETREKLSAAQKGKRTGSENAFFGKHHTKESRDKIGAANSKKVLCVETGIVYKSTKEVKRVLNMSVAAACRTGRVSYGYHWEYVKE